MQTLSVFEHVSLDGYFVDRNGAMSWAKAGNSDPDWNAFVAQNASGESTLLFGRVTYEMMSSWWPSPKARQLDPVVAERMNSLSKVVFSRTLSEASWQNTRLLRGDLAGEVTRLKREPGPGLVVLGSGNIVSQLAEAGLVDEYQLVVNPLVLGAGRTLFDGVSRTLNLRLTRHQVFGNGNVFLAYQPAR